MRLKRKWYIIAPLGIAGLTLFVFIGGEVVRSLWNWLLPPLFGWQEIGFWQALGILALSRILFGGFGGGGHGTKRCRRAADRWEHLTPEERERFRQSLHDRATGGPANANRES